MPLISLDDDDQRWVPTHVNVTVLRARGLRTKGKHGSRYVYTIIQLGKEKYTTGLVEKAAEPEWNEECTFELLPGLLELAGTSAYPPGSSNLVLTVMHRVLIGLDVFLGQTIVPLDKVFQDGMCPRNEWFKLHSKVGRPEKERGDLQVTVQFTRNNLTASMYDLSVKDKRRSAFGKLKDRVTGKKRDVESSSAIVPGRYAALSGSAGQPFGEGQQAEDEQPEEPPVEERERRGSKVKDFFGKLRKSSDTRSCSSLASDSSLASSVGEPFCPPVELSSTPIYSSRVVTDTFRGDTEAGGKAFTPHDPKVMTHKRAYSDEASKITTTPSTSAVPRPCPAVETLKGQSMALSKSSLCINGSHVYGSEPASPKVAPNPGGALPAKRALLEKCSPLSRSLQNLTRRTDDPQRAALAASDGRRWSFDKTKKEDVEQATGQGATPADECSSQAAAAAATGVSAAGASAETSDKGKKLRRTLFSSGRSDSLPAKADHGLASAAHEGRLRGWFGSGESQNKPSLEVFPKVENSPDTPSPLHPPLHDQPQPQHSPPTHPTPVPPSPANGCHANPFTPSPPTSIPISPSNPFLSRLQTNPFFEELLAEEALKSPPVAGGGYTGSPASQYATHFPSPAHRSGTLRERTSIKRERPRSMARQRSLPVLLPGSAGPPPTASSLPNSATNRSLSENISTEWDESFDAFAASRLKSPNGTTPSARNSTTRRQTSNASMLGDHVTHPLLDIRGSGGQEGLSQATDVPPLPPGRPLGVPSRERGSESWLERAEELALEREASFMLQTELASRQHARQRRHKRKTKSWALGDALPAESSLLDLYADPAHHHLNMCLTSAITEVAESSDMNNRILTSDEHGWKVDLSERVSPDAQERRNMERKNNALNSSHFDISKDVLNMALGFATENILDKNPLYDDDNPLTSPAFINSDNNDSEKSQEKFTHTDMEPLGKSLCELSLRPDCTADHSDKPKVTNGVSSFVGSPPDPNKNIDSSDFAFVDSDSSPSEMTINTFEIYDQNANKMLTTYQMFSAVHSSGNPASAQESTAMNSDFKQSELEMLSSTMASFSVCETKQESEHFVLKADSLGNEQRDRSPHYQSSCEEKGGCETHGNASFKEEIRLDFGDERHTSFNCEQPQYPLNPKKQAVGNAIGAEMRGEELTSTPTNCIKDLSLLGFPTRDNDSFTDFLCNKGGCVAGELSPRELQQESNNQRPTQHSDQQSALFDWSVTYNTRSEVDPTGVVADALDGGSHTDGEPQPGDLENSEGIHHTHESELSDLENSQEMSFADLHARVAPSPSRSLRPTGSPPHDAASPSSHPTPVSNATNAKPNPDSHPDPNAPPQNGQPKTGGAHNLAPLTSCSFCSSSYSSSTSTTATVSSCSSCTVQPMVDARHNVTPGETQPASGLLPHPESSPHPVKPLTTSAAAAGDRKSEGRSVLEKLKSTIHPGRAAQPTAAEVAEREARLSEARAQYQNLTNMELISLLLQQEVEVERQREEAELQGALLEKRDAELKKMKVQVRDLEDYIDKLLVRIMEQTPTLLQKTPVKPNS
ncbi:rab11 family-interacting protein 1 [Alosa sapidissima]|uniref:rab11 family-interacting protein 1 n=1 Tax=Alosa sapidissima TaxID=34773 RepID=UPI001C088C8B|nr:rab11 family-interacting protein 1 [Alosa sapidissima]